MRDSKQKDNRNFVDIEMTVAEHSIHITSLGEALKDLAIATEHTNGKLDKVAEALSVQSVIMEKLNNLDANIRDSFKRRDDRLELIEDVQNKGGCSKLNVAEESIKSLGRSIDTVKVIHKSDIDLVMGRLGSVEKKTENMVNGATIKWSIGLLLVVVMSFVGFVNNRYAEISEKLMVCKDTEASLRNDVSINRQLHESNALYYKESLRRIEEVLKEVRK